MYTHSLRFMVLMLLAFSLLVACGGSDDTGSPDGDTPDGDTPDGDTPDGDTPDGDEPDGDEPDGDEPEPPVTTTLSVRLTPTLDENGGECVDAEDEDYCQNPATAYPLMEAFHNAGMGEMEELEGESVTLNEGLGVLRGEPGERRSLFSWAHLSDVHITDEESPNRLGSFDTPAIPSALRPMDMYSELILDATVHTMNRLHAAAAIDLAVFSGDSTDNAQFNELSNFMGVLNGGTVDPDSGLDDDPIEGPGNDPQDSFTAEGLDFPWIIAMGNHDELILGNSPVSENNKASGISDATNGGTRDGATFEVINGTIPADENREPLYHDEFMQAVVDNGEHGFDQDNVDNDQGYYTYDASELVRFIVLDTAYRPEGFEGQSFTYVDPVIDIVQHDSFLVPELDRALSDKKFVVVVGHHPSWKLQDDGFPDRFITTAELTDTLSSYPNVLIHCIGHSHENTLDAHVADGGTGGYFEIQASSLLDWPQQFRLYEIVDNGNGTLSVFTIVTDHQGTPDSLSYEGRRLSLIDVQAGWGEGGPGVSIARNVEMIFPVPDGFADVLESATADETVRALSVWAEATP